jgi:hypothetical protein
MRHGRLPETVRRSLMICAVVAFASPVSAQESYTIKPVYKAGETDRYRLIASIDARSENGPVKLVLTFITSETTKEVKANGTVVVQTKIESGTLNLDGRESAHGAGEVITTTLDKDGRVLKQEGVQAQTTGIANLLALTRVQGLPSEKLKIGDEHKYEVPAAQGSKAVAKGVVILQGIEPKSSSFPTDTLRVKVISDVPAPSGGPDDKLHLDLLILVEPDTGKALKLDGTLTGKLPGLGETSMSLLRTRLPSKTK